MSAVRFGFVGAGWIAHRALAPAVHAADGAVLQAVAARDAGRAAELEPVGRVHDHYQDLLDDPDVDVVYISLSNEAHHPWTLAALAAGKHVLCEKPLGLDAGQVAEMTAAARAADRLLVEGFWYRWHPRTRRLEELVTTGALGAVTQMEADFSFIGEDDDGGYRVDPARGGGSLYDVGCYSVSAAHLVLGPRLSVEEAGSTVGRTGVDLSVWARLRAGSGDGADAGRALVRGGIAVPDRQVLTVAGEVASVAFSEGEAFSNWHAPSTLEITTRDGVTRAEHFAPVDAYRLMVEAVAAHVRGQEAFLVGLDHAAHVAATIDAVRSRLASGDSQAAGQDQAGEDQAAASAT
jgi:predicted dehydrogenase